MSIVYIDIVTWLNHYWYFRKTSGKSARIKTRAHDARKRRAPSDRWRDERSMEEAELARRSEERRMRVSFVSMRLFVKTTPITPIGGRSSANRASRKQAYARVTRRGANFDSRTLLMTLDDHRSAVHGRRNCVPGTSSRSHSAAFDVPPALHRANFLPAEKILCCGIVSQ